MEGLLGFFARASRLGQRQEADGLIGLAVCGWRFLQGTVLSDAEHEFYTAVFDEFLADVQGTIDVFWF